MRYLISFHRRVNKNNKLNVIQEGCADPLWHAGAANEPRLITENKTWRFLEIQRIWKRDDPEAGRRGGASAITVAELASGTASSIDGRTPRLRSSDRLSH